MAIDYEANINKTQDMVSLLNILINILYKKCGFFLVNLATCWKRKSLRHTSSTRSTAPVMLFSRNMLAMCSMLIGFRYSSTTSLVDHSTMYMSCQLNLNRNNLQYNFSIEGKRMCACILCRLYTKPGMHAQREVYTVLPSKRGENYHIIKLYCYIGSLNAEIDSYYCIASTSKQAFIKKL